jgi:RHS repeat-associated protein
MELDNELKGEGNSIDYEKRFYDPRIGRFLSIDPLEEYFPWYTPYQFAGNTPIQAIDLDGAEEHYYLLTFDKGGEAKLTYSHTENTWWKPENEHIVELPQYKTSYTFSWWAPNGENHNKDWEGFKKDPVAGIQSGKFISDQDLTVDTAKSLVKALIVAGAVKASTKIDIKNSSKKLPNSTSKKATVETKQNKKAIVEDDKRYSRVKPRKETLKKVKENQPKNDKGEMLDPNTGQPLDPKRTDLGHKPGEEWKTRKKAHKENNSTRKEVIEAENNPDLYQYEDRTNNRSHKYEKKGG